MLKTCLGDYEIVKTIGEGALGEVVLAQHRFLKRPYALKILSADFGLDADFLYRFEKEVSLLATLDHPNIVKIHTVSEDQGTYFLVTDCVLNEGRSLNLADYLIEQEGSLEEAEVVSIASQIASALDFAHEKIQDGLPFSHEGLKLSNILVKKGQAGITVHLSDFGLGRIMGAGNLLAKTYKIVSESVGKSEQELPKLHQAFLHTFLFLAPEQKSPSYHTKTTKTDTYAFGVVVYYLLTQQFPEGVFALPSEITPHYKLNWDKLIKACLQQDPSKRPACLQQALEEILHLSPKSSQDAPKPILKPGEIVRPQFDADPAAIFQLETTVAKYLPKPQEHKEIEPLLTDMVIIRGAHFIEEAFQVVGMKSLAIS
ncbi:MAG: serine/threonine protein kinase [Rhabdochlamydiaceae bacterium]|jgi:serine/threonine protein kinase